MGTETGIKRSHLRHIRDGNRVRVLGELLKSGGISRHDLTGRTGLTHASVSRITKELIDEGLCYEGAAYRTDHALGRRRVELHVNPEGGYILALCLSVFSRMAVITDITGRRRFETKIPARAARSGQKSIAHVGDWFDDLVQSGQLDRSRLFGAGIVIAGSVDHSTGHLTNAPLLKWRDLPVGDLVRERLQCDVVVENVADALCLSFLDRRFQNPDDNVHMFLVHVAFGMGASLVVDHKLVRRRGDEGWIGRLPLFDPTSGSSVNVLHDASSGEAILQRLDQEIAAGRSSRGSSGIARRLKAAVDASNTGDMTVERVFREAGAELGRLLVPVTSAYSPDVIVLAGPVASAAAYREAARSRYAETAATLGYEGSSIVTNRTRYIEAAENLALRTHMLSRGLRASDIGVG